MGLPIKLTQPLKMCHGVVVGRVALQRQTDEDLRGVVPSVPGKEQRKPFQLRHGAVVVSKSEQMQAESVDLLRLAAGRFHLCRDNLRDGE